jgi:class 3 adenylate cyclase
MSTSEWEAAGLYDPDAPDAAERLELLEYLASLGLSVSGVADAFAHRRIGQLGIDHFTWGDNGPMYTAATLAQHVGLEEERVRAVLRAVGIPSDATVPTFRQQHADVVAAFALGSELFGDEELAQFSRVIGSAAARIAEAAVSLFAANVAPRLAANDAADVEYVRASVDALRSFSAVPQVFDVVLREHFVAAARRAGLLDMAEGGTTPVSVAFVDLVRSTELALDLAADELAGLMGEFEAAAMDAALANHCRVVKCIGDEVMVAGMTAQGTLAVVFDVLDVVDDHPVLGGARAGVTAGQAVARGGDYFGPVVNLAARLVREADPGDVLVDEAVALAAAEAGRRTEPVGPYVLKGFAEPVPAARVMRSRRN